MAKTIEFGVLTENDPAEVYRRMCSWAQANHLHPVEVAVAALQAFALAQQYQGTASEECWDEVVGPTLRRLYLETIALPRQSDPHGPS